MLKNKKCFVVCIDMDDTIENLRDPWIAAINEKYNLNVNPESIISWDLGLFFPSLTNEQIFAPLFEPTFWDTVKPKLNAPYWVKKLIDDGHRVYICTNTHYNIVPFKMDKVLFKYFPYLTGNDLIIMSNKQMIKCDYLIDDGPHNIIGDYIGLLIDMPYNQNIDHPNVHRIHSLEDAYNIISKCAMEA